MTKTLSSLFYDYSSKLDEVVRLENLVGDIHKDIQSLENQILKCDELHEALTTVGILHNNVVYRKIPRLNVTAYESGYETQKPENLNYTLSTKDYILPKYSFELDEKVDTNE